jgi:hypothetical protein
VPRWSTLTMIINHSGETEAAYGIENLDTVNTYKLQKEWTTEYFAGLEFVRGSH